MKNTTKITSSISRNKNSDLLVDLLNVFVFVQCQLARQKRLKKLSWKDKIIYLKFRGTKKSVIRMCIGLIKLFFKVRSEIKVYKNVTSKLCGMIAECGTQIEIEEKLRKIYP